MPTPETDERYRDVVERLRRLDGERHDAATIDAVARQAYLELAGETSAESLPEMLERLVRARLDAGGSAPRCPAPGAAGS